MVLREKSIWAMKQDEIAFKRALVDTVLAKVYADVNRFISLAKSSDMCAIRLWLYVNARQLGVSFNTDIYTTNEDQYSGIVQREELMTRLYDVADLIVAKLRDVLTARFYKLLFVCSIFRYDERHAEHKAIC